MKVENECRVFTIAEQVIVPGIPGITPDMVGLIVGKKDNYMSGIMYDVLVGEELTLLHSSELRSI